ncbi:PadR family transcriptional regulator [Enterococcus sp. AZ196]|uniref:PadR family transcriptional regulator n=1 Tax=Enterococcus sp. AZ196 TaxID=2774659 RepID=UPI003D2B5313
MFDYLVIGMVLYEELTGYDIKKRIEVGVGNLLKASHGQLYPALKKLTDKGYLMMNMQMQGRRQKKYYIATDAGKTAFKEWLATPFDPNKDGDNYLVKLFLIGELPREIRTKRLQEYEFHIRKQLHHLEMVEKQIPTEKLSDRNYFEFASFYYGYQTLHNMLRWVEYIKEQKPLSGYLCVKDE